jgi:cell division protein FtsW (lipid II flippase)
MRKYLKSHEDFIKNLLSKIKTHPISTKELLALRTLHHKRLRFMQHERLIHLIVTFFIALFLLLALGFSMVVKTWTGLSLSIIMLVLVSAYLIHYFHLENGVQRWYKISDEIDEIIRNIMNKDN